MIQFSILRHLAEVENSFLKRPFQTDEACFDFLSQLALFAKLRFCEFERLFLNLSGFFLGLRLFLALAIRRTILQSSRQNGLCQRKDIP